MTGSAARTSLYRSANAPPLIAPPSVALFCALFDVGLRRGAPNPALDCVNPGTVAPENPRRAPVLDGPVGAPLGTGALLFPRLLPRPPPRPRPLVVVDMVVAMRDVRCWRHVNGCFTCKLRKERKSASRCGIRRQSCPLFDAAMNKLEVEPRRSAQHTSAILRAL